MRVATGAIRKNDDGSRPVTATGRHRSKETQPRGFTMLEILLVLALLVIFAGIAVVLVTPAYQRHQVESVGEEVRAKLARVRIHAVDNGLRYQFRYKPGERDYLIVPDEIDADAESGGDSSTDLSTRYPMFSLKLPAGYRFASNFDLQSTGSQNTEPVFLPIREEILKSFPNANDLSDAPSWSAVLFLPDGSATPATITIRDEQKRSITLTVRELTGAVTMGQVKQEAR